MSAAITALVVEAIDLEAMAHGTTAMITKLTRHCPVKDCSRYGAEIAAAWLATCTYVEVDLVATIDRGLVGLVVDEAPSMVA